MTTAISRPIPRPQRRPAVARRHWRSLKRFIDLVLGVPLLLAAVPIIALAALAIVAVDPGPVFYRQTRAGRQGRPFQLWKLRTMVVDADQRLVEHLAADPAARAEWAATCKLTNDPRILPVIGQPLRRFAVDELPQLWNVVRGDLSLIGPRPLPDYHLEQMPVHVRRLRARVRPGLTGLWQVARRDHSHEEMQRLDLDYVSRWSLLLDATILMRTAVLLGSGRHSP